MSEQAPQRRVELWKVNADEHPDVLHSHVSNIGAALAVVHPIRYCMGVWGIVVLVS